MAVASGLAGPKPAELAAGVAAVGAEVAAATALGLLAAGVARPLRAALLAALACAAVGAAPLVLPSAATLLPVAVLAQVAAPGSILDDALRSAGLALLVTSVVLVLARLAMERVEL
jgi:hypothetical protein